MKKRAIVEVQKAGKYLSLSSLIVKGHPLAQRSGRLLQHRYVAYEMHNGVCPPCHWCGKAIDWKSSHVDHLNEVKHDNRPENLVVSCNRCNLYRGQSLLFFKRVAPHRRREAIEAMDSALWAGELFGVVAVPESGKQPSLPQHKDQARAERDAMD